MGLIDEINAISDVIKTDFPTMKVNKQNVPEKPIKGEMCVRFQRNNSGADTSASYVLNREYQIVYFGLSNIDLLTKIDALTDRFNNVIKIPIEGTHYLTVESLSFSQPFKTADNLDAVIGVLVGTTRKGVVTEDAPVVQNVEVKTTSDYAQWGRLDGSLTPDDTSDDKTMIEIESFRMRELENGKFL
ncbi:hypothetical protein CN978_29930 [Priestia megaterium]|uniref:hypothetical protein n=1 Tax=Priestia megaterium TaxID=1404 RepID=UPI000BFE436E|nr:hypothetical protein [Priestia megaterium]PGN53924.1 hypothetical protein CN978_29930 [Priestia megaterium]